MMLKVTCDLCNKKDIHSKFMWKYGSKYATCPVCGIVHVGSVTLVKGETAKIFDR